MPTIDVDGLPTYYEIEGPNDAPVLTLAHGQAFDLTVWRSQVPYFGDRFRVLCPDLRGHGRTGNGDETELRISHIAGDIVGLWDALRVARSHFVGTSLGGFAGYELALEYPERVSSVTFAATQAHMPESTVRAIRKRISGLKEPGASMVPLVDILLERYVSDGYKERDPDGFSALEEIVARGSAMGYALTSDATLAMNYDPRLGDIRVPTMVIAGALDQSTPPGRMQLYQERIAGAQMAVVPDAGHLPNVENSKGFNSVLAGFLDTLEGQT